MNPREIVGIMGVIGYVMLAIGLHLMVLTALCGLWLFTGIAAAGSYFWMHWLRLSYRDPDGRTEE